jgi:hypothetical protein
MHYPMLNLTRCCGQRLCTECYLQLRPPRHNKEPCPFCKHRRVEAVFRGPRSKDELDREASEQKRAIETIARNASQQSVAVDIDVEIDESLSSLPPLSCASASASLCHHSLFHNDPHNHHHHHCIHDHHPSSASVEFEDDDSLSARAIHMHHSYSHTHDRDSLDSSSYASGSREVAPSASASAHASAGSRTRTSFRSLASTSRFRGSNPSFASLSAPPSVCASELGNECEFDEDDELVADASRPRRDAAAPSLYLASGNTGAGSSNLSTVGLSGSPYRGSAAAACWSMSSQSVGASSVSHPSVVMPPADAQSAAEFSAEAAADILELDNCLLRAAIERSLVDC